MNCPGPDDILMTALGRPTSESVSSHIAGCATCRAHVTELRESMGALASGSVATPANGHIDHDVIALLAEGAYSKVSAEELAHIADCDACRSDLALLVRTLEHDAVRAEIRSLEPQQTLRARPEIPFRFVGGLAAAAAVAILLLGPDRAQMTQPPHREAAITTTVAPRIISPIEIASGGDSLRWTSIPQADLYRVRIWDSDGNVIWTTDTRDTTIASPAALLSGVRYMWEIDARTGWDRWVSSDLTAFTLRSP